jgi:hypothetical protein
MISSALLSSVAVLLGLVAAACGDGRSSAIDFSSTLPAPGCSSGTGIGPANRPLTPEEQAEAQARLQADPVIAQLTGAWRVVVTGPFSAECPGQPERLLGASVRVSFDRPQEVSWDEDAVACVDGHAQPTRFGDRWTGLLGATAIVPLPTGTIRWMSVPPDPGSPPARLVQVTKSVLGPAAGSCPKRRSTD